MAKPKRPLATHIRLTALEREALIRATIEGNYSTIADYIRKCALDRSGYKGNYNVETN